MSDDVFKPQRPEGIPGAGGETPIKFSGNVPKEFLEKLQQQNGGMPPVQPQAPPGFAPPPPMPNPMMGNPNLPFNKMNPGNSNSSELQSILDSLKGHSEIYEEITLPSMGKFYDGSDGPADGKIHIRPMTGEEEQILATPRFVKKGQAINMIFSRCIKENFKPENLLSADRTYLLIYLRGISYGPDYEVEVKDPENDRKFSTTIDLNSLPVDVCPDDFSLSDMTDVLPKSNLKFTYRLSKGRDETELQEYRERRLRQFGDQASDDTLIFRTSQLVESIGNITAKNEIQTILRSLPIQDLSYIRSVVNDPPFGVDTKVTIVSPMSSEEFEIELPLEANFFFPRRKRKEKSQV